MLLNFRAATPSLSMVQLATPLANITANLPSNISEALQLLQKEYDDGDLTEQGLIKRQNIILTPYVNASHKEQSFPSKRKLLSLDERELSDWIDNSKMKQLSLGDDMKRSYKC